jgi:hypothetical protein
MDEHEYDALKLEVGGFECEEREEGVVYKINKPVILERLRKVVVFMLPTYFVAGFTRSTQKREIRKTAFLDGLRGEYLDHSSSPI